MDISKKLATEEIKSYTNLHKVKFAWERTLCHKSWTLRIESCRCDLYWSKHQRNTAVNVNVEGYRQEVNYATLRACLKKNPLKRILTANECLLNGGYSAECCPFPFIILIKWGKEGWGEGGGEDHHLFNFLSRDSDLALAEVSMSYKQSWGRRGCSSCILSVAEESSPCRNVSQRVMKDPKCTSHETLRERAGLQFPRQNLSGFCVIILSWSLVFQGRAVSSLLQLKKQEMC